MYVPKPIEDAAVLSWARSFYRTSVPLTAYPEFRKLVHERDALKAELAKLKGACQHSWDNNWQENDYIIEECSKCKQTRRFV